MTMTFGQIVAMLIKVVTSWQVIAITLVFVVYTGIVRHVADLNSASRRRPRKKKPKKEAAAAAKAGPEITDGSKAAAPGAEGADELGIEEA